MSDNVAEIGKKVTKPSKRRCEFPHCWEDSDGLAKRFGKQFCNQHRDLMLLCESYLMQIKEAREKSAEVGSLLERVEAQSSKANIQYVIGRDLMQELKGALVAYQQEVARLKTIIDASPST